jgi:DUF1680 family protein
MGEARAGVMRTPSGTTLPRSRDCMKLLRRTCAAVLLAAGPSLFAGELTARFDRTLERVLHGGPPAYDEAFLLADVIPEDVRRFTNFSGDLSGRYVGALAIAGPNRGAPVPPLDALVTQILGRQRRDGHFGDPMTAFEIRADDMARLWGNGRLLIGLLEYYRVRPRPEVLEAARRAGDFLVASATRFNAPSVERYFNGPQFATGYVCWTQNIEGLVELFRVTSDERYLTLAREMAARTSRHPSQHSHGFLSTLRGILQLAQATGAVEYRQQVEREWQSLVESENWLVQGEIPEAFAPAIERDEGCAEADWLRLNLSLWRMTANPRYLDHAERTLFNGFFMNQHAGGDFGHLRLSATGLEHGAVRAWWCCTLHGLRAFPAVFDAVFRGEGSTLYYDLPVDGSGESGALRVDARSSLEQDRRIQLTVARSGGVSALAVRVPAWAKTVRVLLEGAEIPARPAAGYLHIERAWKPGEMITLEYDLVSRVETGGRHKGYAAVFHGPWLLGVSEDASPEFFDEPYLGNSVLLPEPGPAGEIHLEAPAAGASSGSGKISALAVPAGQLALSWVPAGYTQQPQTTVLRPVAERTAAGLGQWQFWFRVEGGGEDDPRATGDLRTTAPWLASLSVAGFAAALISLVLWRRKRS